MQDWRAAVPGWLHACATCRAPRHAVVPQPPPPPWATLMWSVSGGSSVPARCRVARFGSHPSRGGHISECVTYPQAEGSAPGVFCPACNLAAVVCFGSPWHRGEVGHGLFALFSTWLARCSFTGKTPAFPWLCTLASNPSTTSYVCPAAPSVCPRASQSPPLEWVTRPSRDSAALQDGSGCSGLPVCLPRRWLQPVYRQNPAELFVGVPLSLRCAWAEFAP